MTAGVRVAGFGALLVAIFVLAAITGRAAGPTTIAGGGERQHDGAAGAQHREATTDPAAPELRMVATATTLKPGRARQFSFEIRDDEAGRRVRDFEVEQGRRMHLIVVRRDLRRFQHLHPRQDARGRWSVSLTLPDAGVYHAYADFQTDGRRQVVGTDLFAAGRFAPLPLPTESTSARIDGYDVRLDQNHTGALYFDITRDGARVTDLQPYLGARGHLVMLRAGDLSYVHVHPAGGAGHLHPVDGSGSPTFDETGGVTAGTYRLFFQFRHGDAVHTAAFTRRFGP